jgi:hypothetical protein
MDHAKISDLQLNIFESNGSCLLKVQSTYLEKSIILEPKPPCFFLRRGNNDPQQFAYSDVGVDAVIIIAGSRISKQQRQKWGLSDNKLCGTDRQGILFQENNIKATENVLKGGVVCKDTGSDEKDFWFFAHKQSIGKIKRHFL